jgi:hypothetical protein
MLMLTEVMSNKTAQHGSVMLALLLAGCYQPPTEIQLIRSFESHRAAFDKLLTMAEADKKFYRISGGRIPPFGMSEERYTEYLAVFSEIGVEGGTDWGLPVHPDGLFVIASSCVPLGGRSQAVGYAYLPVRPDSTGERLPISGCPIRIHSGSGHRIVFRALQDHWYLFYDLDW